MDQNGESPQKEIDLHLQSQKRCVMKENKDEIFKVQIDELVELSCKKDSRIEVLSTDVKELEKRLQSAKSRNSDIIERLKSVERKEISLQLELANERNKLENLKREIERLTGINMIESGEKDKYTSLIANLTADLNQKTEKLKTVNSKNIELAETNQTLKMQINTLNMSLECNQTDLDVRPQLAEFNKAPDQRNESRINDLSVELSEKNEVIENLKNELKIAHRESDMDKKDSSETVYNLLEHIDQLKEQKKNQCNKLLQQSKHNKFSLRKSGVNETDSRDEEMSPKNSTNSEHLDNSCQYCTTLKREFNELKGLKKIHQVNVGSNKQRIETIEEQQKLHVEKTCNELKTENRVKLLQYEFIHDQFSLLKGDYEQLKVFNTKLQKKLEELDAQLEHIQSEKCLETEQLHDTKSLSYAPPPNSKRPLGDPLEQQTKKLRLSQSNSDDKVNNSYGRKEESQYENGGFDNVKESDNKTIIEGKCAMLLPTTTHIELRINDADNVEQKDQQVQCVANTVPKDRKIIKNSGNSCDSNGSQNNDKNNGTEKHEKDIIDLTQSEDEDSDDSNGSQNSDKNNGSEKKEKDTIDLSQLEDEDSYLTKSEDEDNDFTESEDEDSDKNEE